jgi:hypothetical protein
MVEALPSDRTDQTFSVTVLPRRAASDRSVACAHRPYSAPDRITVDAILVADQVTRGFIPRKCFGDLSSNPLRSRITRHAKDFFVSLAICRSLLVASMSFERTDYLLLAQDTSLTMHDIARQEHITAGYIYILRRLRWLAPDITTAIVNGQQPRQLNAQKLMRLTAQLPAD